MIITKNRVILLAFFSAVLIITSCSLFSKKHNEKLTLNGTIEVDDIQVGSKIGGRVTEVNVKEGDQVHKGDILFKLDDSELQAKKAQAIAEMQQAQSNIRQREAKSQEVQSGNRIQEINKAKADLNTQKEKLALAIKDAARYEKLYKQGAISMQQRDNAANQVDVLRSQVKSAEEVYNLQLAGSRTEEKVQAKEDVGSAKAVFQQQQHNLDAISTQLNEMTISAPLDGQIEVCDLRPGDLVSPNQGAITMVLPERLWVRVYVPENYLGFLKENQKVEVHVDSFPKESFPGVVEQINRKAEFTPRNVQTVEERVNTVFGVKIKLDNSSGKLRAGMSTDVIFPDIEKK